MRENETEKRDFQKEQQAAWELHCLQFIFEWFGGGAFPIKENCEALFELIWGIT